MRGLSLRAFGSEDGPVWLLHIKAPITNPRRSELKHRTSSVAHISAWESQPTHPPYNLTLLKAEPLLALPSPRLSGPRRGVLLFTHQTLLQRSTNLQNIIFPPSKMRRECHQKQACFLPAMQGRSLNIRVKSRFFSPFSSTLCMLTLSGGRRVLIPLPWTLISAWATIVICNLLRIGLGGRGKKKEMPPSVGRRTPFPSPLP